MRILHAIHSIDVRGGGPIEGIKQLAVHNYAAGHAVEVVSLDAPDHPGIADFPMPIHALGPSHFNYGYSRRYVPWLAAHQHEYDVVIVNGIWQFNSFGVWYALNRTVTPYCVFPHGMLDPWFKKAYPLKHLKKWLYWPWADYRVLRDALAVFFTTEEERRLARRSFWLYRCDEVVLPYGINRPPRLEKSSNDIFFEKFSTLRGKPFLLYLSRIHEKKGCDLLLQAFAQVCLQQKNSELNPSLHLVIAGDGDNPYAHQLKKLAQELGIEDRITWVGLLTGNIKWSAIREAEAFILPSHQENFGIAVAEALACGTPVLISNKVNIWREIHRHSAGLVENDTLEGTKRLLEAWSALGQDEQRLMRINAQRCFDQCFDASRFAEVFLETLRVLKLPG